MDKTSETTLFVKRVIDTSPKEIFDAFTQEDQLRKWFYPIQREYSVVVESDASVSGGYQIDMIDPDGRVYAHKGVIKELVPGQKLSFMWNLHVVEETLVTIRLEEVQQGTKIILMHEFKPSDDIGGHEEGWKELLQNLDKLLTKV